MEINNIQSQANFTAKELEDRRKYFEGLIKRRYFFCQGFEIYGGVAGLYDYGPPGCAIKNNLIKLWRDHFILEEDMLEISSTCITPLPVFKASGHVDRFTDLMVKDVKNGAGHRADKLIEAFIESKLAKKKLKPEEIKELEDIRIRVETLSAQQTHETIQKLGIKSPDTGNELSFPEPFNLMFGTPIGPSGQLQGFLRPETAQGMFVNFNRLNEFNGGKVPFAAAQIGLGFRNEIAPRNGLFRVREFDMAEIEHFFDPKKPEHPKFKYVKDLVLPLLTADSQENGDGSVVRMSLEEAVKKGTISNETHAYFMGRTYLFLVEAGINKNNIRFRQHMSNEMAHYACDCWDGEIEFSHGYKECVGIANRSAFDLESHTKGSGVKLLAARRLAEPRKVTIIEITLEKKEIFKVMKADGTELFKIIESYTDEQKAELLKKFETADSVEFDIKVKDVEKKVSLAKNQISFKVTEQIQQEEKFVPYVIEPSFGIGRIFSAILEHSFRMRMVESKNQEPVVDEKRTFFHLPPKMAPIKVSILPLISHEKYDDAVHKIKVGLTKVGVSSKVDDTGHSIGKRYARTDELGIPFGITIDNDTLVDDSVTLRELLTTKQIRIPVNNVFRVLQDLSDGVTTWEHTLTQFPLFTPPSANEEN